VRGLAVRLIRFDLINLAADALIARGATACGFHPSPQPPTTAQGRAGSQGA
jgi:hypothetical protein